MPMYNCKCTSINIKYSSSRAYLLLCGLTCFCCRELWLIVKCYHFMSHRDIVCYEQTLVLHCMLIPVHGLNVQKKAFCSSQSRNEYVTLNLVLTNCQCCFMYVLSFIFRTSSQPDSYYNAVLCYSSANGREASTSSLSITSMFIVVFWFMGWITF